MSASIYFVNPSTFDEIGEMDMSQDMNLEKTFHLSKFQVVEVDSSVRPARVTILSSHESKEDATEAWKASAVAKIDFYDISHSVLEI
ncbi:MAG: hypothetical protein ACPHCX_00875 [Candidatus Puniceispirillaceae bacterium]|mgnify:FL=1